MYIDFKITTWERAIINNGDEKAILEGFKNGTIGTPDEFPNDADISYEKLDDTDEYMSVDENDGFATVEIFNNNNEIIYTNGKH